MKSNNQKILALAALTEWADTEEGKAHRAALAHDRLPSPVTAEDVFAMIKGAGHDDLCENLRKDLGYSDE